MGLKSIFAGLFSFGRKTRKAEEERPAEAPSEPVVSPYARFAASEPEAVAVPAASVRPGRRTTTNALVFLPVGSTAGSPQPHRRPRIKDAFVLDNIELGPLGTVGLFFPEHAALLIRDPLRGKAGRLIRWEGNRDHIPLFGDWTGLGRETLGFFDPKSAAFHLWFGEVQTEPDLSFLFGPAGLAWVPLVGDWNGDGKDGIGLYDPASSTFVLRNELAGGEPDLCFMYGPPGIGWIPFAGDWDGDGKDGIGIYDPLSGSFLLRNDLSGGNHDLSFRILEAGPDWVPLVGDWNGDGIDSIGIYDPGHRTFYLCNQSASSDTDLVFRFGPVGVAGIPFAVRWVPAPKS
jgi:hypothetical protein